MATKFAMPSVDAIILEGRAHTAFLAAQSAGKPAAEQFELFVTWQAAVDALTARGPKKAARK